MSGYAVGQLFVAVGCIASLKQMMVQETEEQIHLMASPYGCYALVRNALDAAAVAMWLLEPVNGTLRIKRRIMLGVDEVSKTAAFRQTMDQLSTKTKRRARLQEVAQMAGLGDWNPLSKGNVLLSTTEMLRKLERLHSKKIFPWLAAWQLASGHAHGKQWAQIASHDRQVIEGTDNGTSSHFQMSINYGMLAALLFETFQLVETAGNRYIELAGNHR